MTKRRRGSLRCNEVAGAVFPLLLALVALPSGNAAAQLAPTGAHHGARAPDTPDPVGAGTGSGSAIGLDLPAPRAELMVPVRIVSTDGGVGAAGLGWHVPLSYVRRIDSFARRRPAHDPGDAIETRKTVVLSLDGRDIELVQQGAGWAPREDAPQLVVAELSVGWSVDDGHGTRYLFTAPGGLAGKNMWLLTSITAAGNANTVSLDYEVLPQAIPGGTGLSIDLTAVRYDAHPTTAGCMKHEVILGYDGPASAPGTAPLALTMFDPFVLVRTRTLDRVDVRARPDCASPSASLRRYELTYMAGGDTDTKLPRLKEVRVRGREGTPEQATTLPIAAYEYGTATNAGKLRYLQSFDIPFPADVSNIELSSTSRDSTFPAPSGNEYPTWQNLIDVTGDGRPEIVYGKNGDLWFAQNKPGNNGSTTIGALNAIGPLTDAELGPGPLDMHATANILYDNPLGAVNKDEVWRRTIDVNGDGRTDIIDAREEPNHWVVYLNTPGSGAADVVWVRRSWHVGALRATLLAASHTLDEDFIPLSRRATGQSHTEWACWKFDGASWSLDQQANCSDPPAGTLVLPPEPEVTHTDWDLRDLNGDGYPDFVFNTSPTELSELGKPQWIPSPPNPQIKSGIVTYSFGPRSGDGNGVNALMNVVGVRFDEHQNIFSSQITLVTGSKCGLARWTDTSTGQVLGCDIIDVNGDGLLDRVQSATALLGKGAGFSNIELALPDAVGRYANGHSYYCLTPDPDPPPATTTYPSEPITALRDLTGDGIPDFVRVIDNAWNVHIGTGTGFAPPIPIEVPGSAFALSFEKETCDGENARTTSGLYDIDGDAKPDLVHVVPGNKLAVYQLTGGWTPRTPEAGRIVSVDNGYGAKTTFQYRSAKEDGTTRHQVPGPEIVLTSVETTGTLGLGGNASAMKYAYGGSEVFFDPMRDTFATSGFGRSVALRVMPSFNGKGTGTVVITDAEPLAAIATTKDQAHARYSRAGRPAYVHQLSGTLDTDPWKLLTTDVATDTRLTSGVHHTWADRLFHPSQSDPHFDCFDVTDPYDWITSVITGVGYDVCHARGFAYDKAVERWRGYEAPPSAANVATRSEVLTVDDFGRALLVSHENDVFRADDDVCEETIYADSTASGSHVLDARASRRTKECGKATVFARESWEYDDLAPGLVSAGWPTAHTIERRATDTGALLDAIREWEMTYDEVGNPIEIFTEREDGAYRQVTFGHDPFGLAMTSSVVNATGALTQTSTIARDPISLDVLTITDPIGMLTGKELDGFGRVVRQLAAPAGTSAIGVTSVTSYLGFAGSDPLGRRVTTKAFVDPVPPANANTTTGRIGTVFLDELGRERRTEIALGADYAGETLVTRKTYDVFGRVKFAADPYTASQDASTAYGTTHYFNADGSPQCSIRGYGEQALTSLTDEAAERFPTCYERSFAANQETVGVRDAASLLPVSPQANVVTSVTSSAIGWMLSRQTIKNTTRLEYETFGHDRLGGLTQTSRYQDAVNATGEVKWLAALDSMGQKRTAIEPESAQRSYTYSDWGELLETQWVDAGVDRRVTQAYDGLGRTVSRVEKSGGAVVPDAEHMYFYDAITTPVPGITTKNVLGRLSAAKSATGDVYVGYDGFGRANLQVHTEVGGVHQIEKSETRFDGLRRSLDLLLSDTGYATEHVDYTYDSAARLRTVKYTSGKAVTLYNATQIDAWGRARAAKYGPQVDLLATFADVGRRLPIDLKASSPLGARQVLYFGFDPMGREKSRREIKNNAASGPKTNFGYDALGRLASANQSDSPVTYFNTLFTYDALGNVSSLADTVTALDATLSYRTAAGNDRDRICRIGYGNNGLGGTACNVVHDGVGNIVQQPTRSGVTRLLEHLPSGLVRKINQGAAQATFRYDPFGEVLRLDVEGTGVTDKRHDRHFGSFIERREVIVGGVTQQVLIRKIPGVSGIFATRRGAAGPWVFDLGEARGGRFFTDETGAFVQDVTYRPFGEATSTGASPGALQYSNEQWNGGDALAAFGLSQLGARIYDPVIGRFLSRDPLLIVRTAASTNPYAFSRNDPQNLADPTGLDASCAEGTCSGIQWKAPDFGLLFPSWNGRPITQRIPWLDRRVNSEPYFSPPAYDYTFDLEKDYRGYNDLSPEEKRAYIDAPRTNDFRDRFVHAFAYVTKFRYDHRFDKMGLWKEVIAKGAEQYSIESANDRRVLMFEDGKTLWRETANITPELVAPGTYEVWAHGGHPDHLWTGKREIGVYDVIGTLFTQTEWVHGDPIVLNACGSGAFSGKFAQQLADATGSVVYASTHLSWSIPGAPDIQPYGWSVYWPVKK